MPWRSEELKEKHYIIRRPSPIMQGTMPVSARSVCWGVFAPGAKEDNSVQPFAKILWCVRGTGLVRFSGKTYPFNPGQIALFLPGTLHSAWAGEEEWEVRWWTMDGPLVNRIIAGFGLTKEGLYDTGAAPTATFEELREAIQDVTPAGEVRAATLAYELLGIASLHPRPLHKSSLIEEATEILESEWSDSSLNIEQLARRLETHRSSLSRRFTALHGLSPSQYLSRIRMQNALSLLKQTDAPVAEIANHCGYADPSYFVRVFRKTQGMTPLQWRE